jgi:hypothetical protein
MWPAWTRHEDGAHAFGTMYTDRNGHTGAHDPVSNQLIHAWRADDLTMMIGLSSSTGDALTTEALAGNNGTCRTGAFGCASSTPEIACAPNSSTTRNCIMVWASQPLGPEDTHSYPHNRVIKYVQFGINGTDIDWGAVKAVGYSVFGPPSIVFKGPKAEDPFAFVLAWKNPGQCFYTMRKSVYESDTFSDIRGHCGPNGTWVRNPMTAADASGNGYAWVRGTASL